MLVFGERHLVGEPELWKHAHERWPRADVVTCSSAGEIAGARVLDDSLVATAVQFASTRIVARSVTLREVPDARSAGERLAAELDAQDLRHVFVLSDGIHVNGSELVRGMTGRLPVGVALTGGLSADGSRFQRTIVNLNAPSNESSVVAIGFYGARLQVGYASLGGWDAFGPDRLITRSAGNVLYELDGQPALDLYKRYLGEFAAGLPASALLFPLAISNAGSGTEVVRTILGVDEEAKCCRASISVEI